MPEPSCDNCRFCEVGSDLQTVNGIVTALICRWGPPGNIPVLSWWWCHKHMEK